MRHLALIVLLLSFCAVAPAPVAYAAPTSVQASPTTVLQLWLQLRHLARNGTGYTTELNALAHVLPAEISEDAAWKQLQIYAENPPPSHHSLQQQLRNLLAPTTAPSTTAEPKTILARVRMQLAKHLRITSSKEHKKNAIRARLLAHANNGELKAAARLIGEQSAFNLSAWQRDYVRYQTEMHLLAHMEIILRKNSLNAAEAE